MADGETTKPPGDPTGDPRAAAVTFVTTEHFTLQGARSSTIAEAVGRASMFLTAVSGGLVALGLVATATQVGTTFYAFGFVLLPTLAFIGLFTFARALQSGIEDHGYAVRIARLRAFYFDNAPEVTPYLASVPPGQRLVIEGLRGGFWQTFRTVAGMVSVVTAVLAGSTVGLAVGVSSSPLGAAVGAGLAAGLVVLGLFARQQVEAWKRSQVVAMFDNAPPEAS